MLGTKYGKWTLLKEYKHDQKYHDTRYECLCDCGAIKIVRRNSLRSGRSVACRSCAVKKHGYTGTPTYIVWESMLKRCGNSKAIQYKYYGGKGIVVCESWKKSFLNFLEDMGERPEGKELDRIDNDGNYEKNNCRWVTHKENLGNRKCSKK